MTANQRSVREHNLINFCQSQLYTQYYPGTYLAQHWTGIRFRKSYHGTCLQVVCQIEQLRPSLLDNNRITCGHLDCLLAANENAVALKYSSGCLPMFTCDLSDGQLSANEYALVLIP